MTRESSAAAVTAFAGPFDEAYAAAHGATSPLGAWLLLALVAPAAEDAERAELERVLGLPAQEAAATAGVLLADPPGAVLAAAARWADAARLLPGFADWTVPAPVETGSLPSQAEADAWADRHTAGKITEFPMELTEDTLVVLASALATEISWAQPLSRASAADLGGAFGATASQALRLEVGHGLQLVTDTAAAGPVAVAAPAVDTGLVVLSVIADPAVAPADVHRAAHEVAAQLADGRLGGVAVNGDGHAWTVGERMERRATHADEVVEVTSWLPAWSATSDHDLGGAPGMAAAFATLSQFARPEDRPVACRARQVAMAEYTRTGFRAAAVSAIGAYATGAPVSQEVLVRRVEVRFDRPYAVLALVDPADPHEEWRGMPVFSAWVAQPD